MKAESVRSQDSGRIRKGSRNIEWFKDEHISLVKSTLAKELHYFGYSNAPRSSADCCESQSGTKIRLNTPTPTDHSFSSIRKKEG